MAKCRKVRYRDHIAAKLALAKLVNRGKQGHDEVRAYRCPDCAGFHLTSKRRNRAKRSA